MGVGGGRIPQLPKAIWGLTLTQAPEAGNLPEVRGLGEDLPALGDFCIFFTKNKAFLCIFRPK